MPKVKSLSDFNRNQSSIIEELQQTGEPIYLTRNGSASLVVMDAESFDRQMSLRASALANEMKVYDSLMAGYADYLEGNVVDAAEAEASLMKDKGWIS